MGISTLNKEKGPKNKVPNYNINKQTNNHFLLNRKNSKPLIPMYSQLDFLPHRKINFPILWKVSISSKVREHWKLQIIHFKRKWQTLKRQTNPNNNMRKLKVKKGKKWYSVSRQSDENSIVMASSYSSLICESSHYCIWLH